MRFSRVGGPSGAVRLSRQPAQSSKGTGEHPEHVAESIEEIVTLESRDRAHLGFSDKIASIITAFSGSMLYVWLHVAWFTIWIIANISLLVLKPFDPYPFGLLTMIVSLEAIFLSTFVLITQNRQAIAADRRSKVDLQVNMVAEREVTKLIDMVKHLHEHLGLDDPDHDQELAEMQKPTHVTKIADAIDEAEQKIDSEGPS